MDATDTGPGAEAASEAMTPEGKLAAQLRCYPALRLVQAPLEAEIVAKQVSLDLMDAGGDMGAIADRVIEMRRKLLADLDARVDAVLSECHRTAMEGAARHVPEDRWLVQRRIGLHDRRNAA